MRPEVTLTKALAVSIVASLAIPGVHFIFLATGLLGSLLFSDIWFMGITMPRGQAAFS